MKRILVPLAAVAGLVVSAGPAAAADATWQGVVVAKDNGRSAVVTASANGVVRTARSPRARTARIGQRLTVTGTLLADGTFAARTLRVTGKARTARLKAVVVSYRKAQRRLLVSAGGSTFALPRRATRTLAALGATAGEPAAGDRIVATVTVTGSVAAATSVSTVGRLGTLEVEGILTKVESGSVELLVARAGYVTVALPSGFALPAGLKVFDPAKLVVAVGTDGKLTLLAIQGDESRDRDDDGVDFDEDDNELEVEGKITALSDTSVTVQPGAAASPVTCSLTRPLTAFAVGNRVELKCVAGAGGALVLRKIEREDDEEKDEDEDDDSEESDDTDDEDSEDDSEDDSDDDTDD